LGDWELDTIIGKGHKQAIVSLTERKSRLILTDKVERKSPSAILRLLNLITRCAHTLTSVNGKEFVAHETIAKVLGTKLFFAHPLASWERGLNENTNGLTSASRNIWILQPSPRKKSTK
jgi:IS30 family transposase